jgi:cardiolipin synthase
LQQLPNLITSLRLVASPVLVWLLFQSEYKAALGLVLFAGLSDWFDGFTARHFGATGGVGAILDPVADKTMLVVLFITLGVLKLIPLWLMSLVIARDLVIVTGSALLRVFRNLRRFRPLFLGKVSTFFQIVFVLLVVLDAAFPHYVFSALEELALFCTAVFTSLSGIAYIRLGIRLAQETGRIQS